MCVKKLHKNKGLKKVIRSFLDQEKEGFGKLKESDMRKRRAVKKCGECES